MRKLVLLHLLLISVLPAAIGQANTSWLVEGEHTGTDYISDAVFDELGNAYVVGHAQGSGTTIVGGLSINVTSFSTTFLAKINPAGFVLWLESFEAKSTRPQNLAYANGQLFFTGQFWDSIQFGTIKLLTTNTEQYFVSTDTSGVPLWAKKMEGIQLFTDLIPTSTGNVIMVGEQDEDLDLGSGISPVEGSSAAFVAEFEPTGNNLWLKTYNCELGQTTSTFYYSRALAATIDQDDNLYLVGDYQGDFVFSGVDTLKRYGDSAEVFVLKLDPAGNPLWAEGSKTSQFASAVVVSASDEGMLYVGGVYSQSPFLFGGTVFNSLAVENFIFRMDASDGSLLDHKMMNTSISFGEMRTNSAGQVYLTGAFNSGTPLDFGNGVIGAAGTAGQSTGYLLTMDSLMTSTWVKTYGGSNTTSSGFLSFSDTYERLLVGGLYYLDFAIDTFSGTAVWGAQAYVASMDVTLPSDSTWPGDANLDLVADNNDLLAIGLAYGETGPARPNASLAWIGQPGFDWNDSLPSGINHKHVDTNGDGIVDANDTLAILQNYGLTHNKGDDFDATGPPLSMTFLEDSLLAGDTATIIISYGVDTLIATDVYGLAFTLQYDSTLIDPASIVAGYSQSWLGQNGIDLIKLEKNFPTNGEIDLALTRTDHNEMDGFGEICRLRIIMVEDLTGKTVIAEAFTMEFADITVINAEGQDLPFNPQSDTMIVYQEEVTGIDDHAALQQFLTLYPNPADEFLHVEWNGTQASAWQLLDLQGREVAGSSGPVRHDQIAVGNFPSGIYVLTISTEEGEIARKVEIR